MTTITKGEALAGPADIGDLGIHSSAPTITKYAAPYAPQKAGWLTVKAAEYSHPAPKLLWHLARHPRFARGHTLTSMDYFGIPFSKLSFLAPVLVSTHVAVLLQGLQCHYLVLSSLYTIPAFLQH